jgi:FMN phosphatase YigB (HAD superfamily)
VELYRRALQQAGVQPEEALHAGDDIGKDLLGAQQAGLRAVLVDHARAHANISPAVSGLDQLAEIVDRLTT